MELDKILEMLQVDKLDESKQAEVKEKLDEIIDVKAKEKVQEKENELKEQLTEEYEEKFEEYKNDISEKFSNFVDTVLDEEMQIPDNVKEYARKGELYEEVIEALKTKMAIDEGLVDDEAKNLLRESRDEIKKLREQTNGLMKEKMQAEQDAKEFAANLYIREKCEGLDLKTQEKVLALLEGITDRNKIDRKFDIVLESVKGTDNGDDKTNLNEETKGQQKTDSQLNENEDDDPFAKQKNYWLKQMQTMNQ